MLDNRTKYSGGKLGVFYNNENICVGSKFFFIPPASVGTVSAGIFGGNDNSSDGFTAFTRIREIKGISAVELNKELLISIWKYFGVMKSWYLGLLLWKAQK